MLPNCDLVLAYHANNRTLLPGHHGSPSRLLVMLHQRCHYLSYGWLTLYMDAQQLTRSASNWLPRLYHAKALIATLTRLMFARVEFLQGAGRRLNDSCSSSGSPPTATGGLVFRRPSTLSTPCNEGNGVCRAFIFTLHRFIG